MIDPGDRDRRSRKWKRWERGAPMELWQLDVVGGFPIADGTSAKALTGLDDHSRLCVSARLMAAERTRAVCAISGNDDEVISQPGVLRERQQLVVRADTPDHVRHTRDARLVGQARYDELGAQAMAQLRRGCMTSSPASCARAWVFSSSITKQALPPGPRPAMKSSVSGSRSR